MNSIIINQLKIKIEKDYEELENKWLSDEKEKIINHSYKIAVHQNFYDGIQSFIEDFEEGDSNYFVLDDFTVGKILDYKGNIISALYDGYMSFRHPERFDFWYSYHDGLTEIIEIIAKECL